MGCLPDEPARRHPRRSPTRTERGPVLGGRAGPRLAAARCAGRSSAGPRACGRHEVVLASPRSFCAGVERAIEIVERALERYGAPVYVRRQIVHNLHVVRDLESKGAVFVEELDEVPARRGRGAGRPRRLPGRPPPGRRAQRPQGDRRHLPARGQGAHRGAPLRRARTTTSSSSATPTTRRSIGTLGEAPDRFHVVEDAGRRRSELDARARRARSPTSPRRRSPPTRPPRSSRPCARRFPEITAPPADDICYATQNRQDAVRQIAHRCDLLLVVGSANSSNTARLVEVARREGCRAELIEDASQLRARLARGRRDASGSRPGPRLPTSWSKKCSTPSACSGRCG